MSYTRIAPRTALATPPAAAASYLVEGEGFEPSKAWPADLQSAPFDRSGTPPNETRNFGYSEPQCQMLARSLPGNQALSPSKGRIGIAIVDGIDGRQDLRRQGESSGRDVLPQLVHRAGANDRTGREPP